LRWIDATIALCFLAKGPTMAETVPSMRSREIKIGKTLVVGGLRPIVVQSMINTSPLDFKESAEQISNLAAAGAHLVRLAVPTMGAARTLGSLAKLLGAKSPKIALSADVHFLPEVAFEALKHVEKVRINPGNFAEHRGERGPRKDVLERFWTSAKDLGRTVRVGVNHGSLSRRILKHYGNTPIGMVESALEYIVSAERHGFFDLVVSLKSSDVRTVIRANQSFVKECKVRCSDFYPVHLGVTEAGLGKEARVKSAVGIGVPLMQGIGDTVRLSLTEPSTNEIAVARTLLGWIGHRRPHADWPLIPRHCHRSPTAWLEVTGDFLLRDVGTRASTVAVEGYILKIRTMEELDCARRYASSHPIPLLLDCTALGPDAALGTFPPGTIVHYDLDGYNRDAVLAKIGHLSYRLSLRPHSPAALNDLREFFDRPNGPLCAIPMSPQTSCDNCLEWAKIVLRQRIPIWLRNDCLGDLSGSDLVPWAAMNGFFLCYGYGHLVSIEANETNWAERLHTLYDLLQACRLRCVKTEFVSCPSCARTQFDIAAVAAAVKERLSQFGGIKIAVMGCVVNGPGEMADADFGYVGAGPNKVNLYVRHKCVQFGVDASVAIDRLEEIVKREMSPSSPKD
jgi:(E)-4-hydroxy-3-methylbut-2-enyl-diphosphate synthase